MGSPDNEKGRAENEGPLHPVTVKPFWMAKLECAWDEYDVYWENRPKGPPQRPDISKKLEKLPDAITSPTPPYEDPTFGYFPSVYYYQGRVREGMQTGFAASYREYLKIRGQSKEDPLLPDVRRRAGN